MAQVWSRISEIVGPDIRYAILAGGKMFHKPVFLIAFLFTMIAQAQTPGHPGWNLLAQESTTIVTGTVTEGKLWVIDPNKRRSDSTNIPNPADFVIGRIIHL